jgi:hypothetical protein
LIVEKKLLEGLTLDLMPDAPDGSRAAVTTGAQTFYGLKVFENGGQAARDTTKADKSLIVKADMSDTFSDFPIDHIDMITLDAAMIAAKEVTLSTPAASGLEDAVMFQVVGSDWFIGGYRFTVTSDVLSWNGFDYTEELLKVGDVLYIHYIG